MNFPIEKFEYPPEFQGDGRNTVAPIPDFVEPKTRPIQMTRSRARDCCDRLAQTGQSVHSQNGSTLWISIALCKHNGWVYDLTGGEVPGFHLKITGLAPAAAPRPKASRR